MAANLATPVAVGTQGTVGSLIRKEIEYFKTVEFTDQMRSEKRRKVAQSLEMGSASSNSIHCKAKNSRPGFWLFGLNWRRKKQRVCGGFRSSVYSASDASDIDKSDGIRGFNYVILRDEFKNFQSY